MSLTGIGSAAVAFLLALAVTPSLAQGVDPTSRQNVAPRTGGESAVALEGKRKELFSAMLRDPANLDIAFAYAAVSVQLGDLESAISTLERMLIFSPGLPRLQYELGILYYRLGAYDTARTYLETVAANADTPAEVKSEVALYLASIENRVEGTIVGGVITTGLRYQTNANAGPASAFLELNGVPLTLNPGAVNAPDTNAFVSANIGASVDLESQGDRFDFNLAAYGALYANQTQLNTGIVEATFGPTFNLQRFDIENATLGIYGIVGGALLGGNPYLASAGAGVRESFTLDARSRLLLKKEVRYEQFFNSAARPTAANRSGWRFSAAATHQFQLTEDVLLFGTLGLDRRNAQVGFLSTWTGAATVGASFSFDSPIAALDEQWVFTLTGGGAYEVADAPDPVFSPTTPETSTQVFAQGALTVPFGEGFALNTSAGYLAAFSNYPLGTYTNATGTVGVSKRF